MRIALISVISLVACTQSAEYAPQDDSVPTAADTVESDEETIDPHAMQQLGVVRGMVEIKILPSELVMGLDSDDEDFDSFHIPHVVELTHDWAIMKTEVTHAMWESVMSYSLRDYEATLNDAGCDDCPARNVSWHEAQAYANAISSAAGLEECFACEGDGPDVQCEPVIDPYDCSGFRLPTEAEWEHAARGGEDYVYPGSDSIDEIAYWEDNSNDQPYPVMSKAPNGYGLYDMGGNIRERVYDAFLPYTADAKINPVAMPDFATGETEIYSERGGSFACRRPEIRWNRRNLVWDYERDIHTGFRLARILD